jgi:4-amino-4-deoxy-L-arabinose transferase-like glycosyltransferase
MMNRWAKSVFAPVLLFFSYLIFLWKMSVPLTGDQKVYLSIALEMRERGEYLIPYLFDRPNFLKPPLQYWATLGGWGVFGFGMFGALFPSVLAFAGSAILTKRLSMNENWLPAVFFSSTLASMTYGTTAQMEIWVVLFYLSAWYLMERKNDWLGWISVGIMSWIKGPLYSVLWSLGWGVFLAIQGRFREVLSARAALKILIGVLAGILWFLLAWNRFPDEVTAIFLKRENLEKLNTPQGSMIGLWAGFISTLMPLLPWLVMGFFDSAWRARVRDRGGFLFSYAILPALFFTFFPYRVGTYLYILTPVAVWCMADRKLELPRNIRVVFSALVFVVGAALTVFVLRLYSGEWITGLLAMIAVASTLFWIIGHWAANPAWIAISSLCLVQVVRVGAVELGERDLAALRTGVENDSAPLAYFMEHEDIWHESGLVSAALGRRVRVLRRDAEIPGFLDSGGKLILTDEQLDRGAGLSCTGWNRLKRRMKFPLRELIVEGLRVDEPRLYRRYLVCGRART